MTQHIPGRSHDERCDTMARASIDGRAAFAAAVFIVGIAIFALLDRIGAPHRLVATLGPALAALSLAAAGFMLRSMSVSGFHAAGRGTPGVYAGLAMVGLGAGLAAPFTSPAPGSAPLAGLLTGFGMGMALAGLGVGPLMRKTGAFSLADFVAARFDSLTVRVGVAIAAAALGLCLGLAGLAAAQDALVQATGLKPQPALFLAAIIMALMIVPGGMAGLVWSAAGAAGLAIAGVAAPLVLAIASGATVPLPLGDDAALQKALTLMAQWRGAAPDGPDGLLILAMTLGLGALPVLLAPLMTIQRSGQARGGGFAGLVWFALLALMALVLAGVTALALQSSMTGLRPLDLPPFLLEASGRGLVAICGAHPVSAAQVREACALLPGFAGTLRPSDVTASVEFLLLALPDINGYGAAFSGLIMAGRMAIALTLGAAGFMAMASAWGQSPLRHPQKARPLTSRRLALTRFLLLAAIAGACFIQIHASADPRLLVGAALGLSAVAIAPLLALAMWPRAEGLDGAVALVAGLAIAEAALLLSEDPQSLQALAQAAVTGFASAVAAGVAASFRHPADPGGEGVAFVHGLLHGRGDVMRLDKGV